MSLDKYLEKQLDRIRTGLDNLGEFHDALSYGADHGYDIESAWLELDFIRAELSDAHDKIQDALIRANIVHKNKLGRL